MATTLQTGARLGATLALVIGALVVAPAQECWACSCIEQTVPEAIAGSDVVVDATLVAEEDTSDGELALTFEVHEVFKGSSVLPSTLTVYTERDGSACGLEANVGERRFLFGSRGADDRITGSLCQGLVTTSARELRAELNIDTPRIPPPTTPAHTAPATDLGSSPWWRYGVPITVGTAAAGLSFWLLGRRSSQ